MLRILDLGCHDAFVALWLARQLRELGIEARIDGIELNPGAVEIAERRFRTEEFQGTFVCADALDAPEHFEPGSFDAVVAYELIEHVPNPEALLEVAEAMTKPEGRVYCSSPAGTFGEGRNPHHLRVYRAHDLADLLRRRGRLQDMTVGGDGISVAAYSPAARKGDIAIYVGPGWEPWAPYDVERRGLGGSETAAIRLAQHLSELGFIVTVYGEISDQCVFRDVIYRHHLSYDPMDRRLATISSRIPELYDRKVASDVRMLWLHDTDAGDRLIERRAERIDHVLVLSEWHEGHVGGLYPFLRGKLRRIRNGIEHAYFRGEALERQRRVLYTSSPDRGLDILLELWPQVRERVPDAELAYCYSAVYDQVAAQRPEISEHRDKVRRLEADLEGVTNLGSLPQPKLARLMRESMVWAHPSWATPYEGAFHETSCLTGDTLIDMPRDYRTHPDGVPIGELEGRGGFPVWAWDEGTHRFTLATAKRVWRSRRSAQTIRIRTDEGTTLTCTPDHRVLTFDGDWVEAGALAAGDRLRGLNYRFQVNVNLGDGRWTAEHRMVGEWMEGRKLERTEHVHHLGDPTRLDNRPAALEVLPAGEHHSRTHKGREYSREWKAKRRAIALAWKETPEGQAHYAANARKAGQNLWEWLRSLPEEEKRAWLSARAESAAATVRERLVNGTDEEREEYRQKMSARGRKGNEARRQNQAASSNHRVLSIEEGPTVDVFDMEVEELHSFVAGGIVVHNCIGALEAQAAGCLVVASGWGALPETVQAGRLVNSEPLGDRWREAFVEHIVEGLTDESVQRWVQKRGPEVVADLGWDGVAEQVAGLIEGEAFAYEGEDAPVAVAQT